MQFFRRQDSTRSCALGFCVGVIAGSTAAFKEAWYINYIAGQFCTWSLQKSLFGAIAKTGYITGFVLGYVGAYTASYMNTYSDNVMHDDYCPLDENTCPLRGAFQ